ncbi:hypothetical protein BJ165DRAFT_1497311 [Panaeolus papilionaceus]|nr:hypothetical protein BJ165DRAFT_1497311 [Panaeolus papilionaceus]
MTTSTVLNSKIEERDLAYLARILESGELIFDNGGLSCKFYDIGDAGCSLLFRYLDGEIDPVAVEQHANHGLSECPQKPRFTGNQTGGRPTQDTSTLLQRPQKFPTLFITIDLWSVNMSDSGFGALISWHSSRQSDSSDTMLRILDLRRNLIIGNSELARDFIQSITSTPSQSLQTLVLSNNPLSPAFRRTLISLLHNISSLRELGLSMIGMTSKDGKALGKYFTHTSPPCRLVKFNANANQLGVKGIRHIVNALRHCYSLEVVELYANSDEGLEIGGSSSDNDDEEEGSSSSEIANAASYRMLEQIRSRYLMRNYFLKSNIKDQALELLKATRVLMSKPIHSSVPSHSTSLIHDPVTTEPLLHPISAVDATLQGLTINYTSFSILPNELKLAILTELAPNLSHQQFIRVVEYGSSRQTLPKVMLSLPTRQLSPRPNQPSPTSPRRFGSLIRTTTTSPSAYSNLTTPILASDKEKQLQEWLSLVGCNVYEASDQNEVDFYSLT